MAAMTGHGAASVGRSRNESSKLLAHVLIGLLMSDLALAAAGLVIPLVSRSDTAFQLQIDLKSVVILWRLAFAATVVVFLVWFYQAKGER